MRLTPEDEKRIREDDAKYSRSLTPTSLISDRRSCLAEIDALRAEMERLTRERDLLSRGLDIETAEIESLHEEIEMLRADDDPSFVRHAEHLAVLKTVEQLRAEIERLTRVADDLQRRQDAAFLQHSQQHRKILAADNALHERDSEIRRLKEQLAITRHEPGYEPLSQTASKLEIQCLKAEIATFRNASPSLCNCSQCLDLRKTTDGA